MKKSLFFIGALAVAVLFSACKPEDPTAGVTSVKVQPEEIVLAPGDQVRLSPSVVPEGTKVSYTWSSSNDSIATVSENGTVTAMNNGQAVITCAVGEHKAQCKVTVKDYAETIIFTQAYIGISDIDSINTVDYHHSELGDLKVHVCDGVLRLFSAGFYYGSDGKLTGTEKGAMANIETPLAIAEAEDNPSIATQYPNGVFFSLGAYGVDDYENPSWHQGKRGKIDDAKYISGMKNWMDEFNAAGKWTQENYEIFTNTVKESVSGAIIHLWEYGCEDESDASTCGYDWTTMGTPDALVVKADIWIEGNEGSSKYMDAIDYIDMDAQYLDGLWGMDIQEDVVGNDTIYKIANDKVLYKDPIKYTYGEKPAEMGENIQGVSIMGTIKLVPNEMKEVKLPNNFELRVRK